MSDETRKTAGAHAANASPAASARDASASSVPRVVSGPRVVLGPKGRRWFDTGHPWVYADDVVVADAEPGDVVAIVDHRDRHLGFGLYSAGSRIAVRWFASGRERPDRAHWRARIERAVAARARMGLLVPRGTSRLISGDADGVPGLVVDRYADVLVVQCGTQGADRLRELVVELLEAALPFRVCAVFDRSDSAVRRLEGLEARVGVVKGELPDPLVVRDVDLEYEVDVHHGHKTGHYLDQRDNRRRAARFATGEDVLDAFAYDGLFGISAALAGARSVVCVDQSEAALARLERNAERNGVRDRVRVARADCMSDLRERARAGERYGLVIVDPPAFAKNRREIEGAERGYIEINRRALELVRAGGRLVTASCSYNLRAQAFFACLGRAAHGARREAYVEEWHGAAPDHPVLATLPETAYLKCAYLRVEDAPTMSSGLGGADAHGPSDGTSR